MKREELAYQAAVMYYVNEETMSAIAHHLDVSRSTVSRLLRDARELGLVQIVLSPPQDAPSHEARELNRRFGVQAHIVPVPASANSMRSSQAVAGVAGVVTLWLLGGYRTDGFPWGNQAAALISLAVGGLVMAAVYAVALKLFRVQEFTGLLAPLRAKLGR